MKKFIYYFVLCPIFFPILFMGVLMWLLAGAVLNNYEEYFLK